MYPRVALPNNLAIMTNSSSDIIEMMDLTFSDGEPPASVINRHRPSQRPSSAPRRAAPASNRVTADPQNLTEQLLSRLLALRALGRPPFLMRNLSYVKANRELARRRSWDLRCLAPSTRASSSPRHLVLSLRPSVVRLRPGVARQLLHPDTPLSKQPENPYFPRVAKLSLSLVVHKDAGRVAFGHRAVTVRVWPSEHLENGIYIDDLPAKAVFDLSAALALLGSSPAALSLLLELRSDDPAAKILNSFPATLRGELLLLDQASTDKPVPNGKVSVPLRFTTLAAEQTPQVRPGMTSFSRENLLREDDRGGPGRTPAERRRQTGKAKGKTPGATRPPDATLILDVQGTIAHANEELKSMEQQRVHFAVTYSSSNNPAWNGLVRHDFVCPWCHRNCYRFRTLVNHFQIEHEEMAFAMSAVHGPGSAPPNSMVKGVEFTMKFEVMVASDNVEDGKKNLESLENYEDFYANPTRFPSYAAPLPKPQRNKNAEMEADEVEVGMSKVSLKNQKQTFGRDADSEGTNSADDDDVCDRSFPEVMKETLWNCCKNCLRPHPKSNVTAVDRQEFCSEFCEVIFKKKMEDEKNIPECERGPILEHSSVPRPLSFDYEERLGKLKLYHVVSVCEAKKEHFREDDPDSEEEVDHSWRLDLSMERIRHLDDATPKEKLVWMMWNKFSHENYPIPSLYAERYTRYTLELFALEYGKQIALLKLRVQFFGFLRALHIHGMLDSVATLSIMKCLDGKKKRRNIKNSVRPELPREGFQMRGSTKVRRGRKRNGSSSS